MCNILCKLAMMTS